MQSNVGILNKGSNPNLSSRNSILTLLSLGDRIRITNKGQSEGFFLEAEKILKLLSPTRELSKPSSLKKRIKKAELDVCGLEADANLKTMFGSFQTDLDTLCLDPLQIALFMSFQEYLSRWFRKDEHATFFLCKNESAAQDSYFVICAHIDSEGSSRYIKYSLESKNIWDSESAHHLIIQKVQPIA